VKVEKQYQQVKSEELLYVEATGNYSTMHFKKEKIVVHEKISDLENRLPMPSFMRVHRSFIVAVDKITSIQGNIIVLGNIEVPIGQSYSKAVRDELLKRG
jgi:DNA-binding LytR/AlgR family response regulator